MPPLTAKMSDRRSDLHFLHFYNGGDVFDLRLQEWNLCRILPGTSIALIFAALATKTNRLVCHMIIGLHKYIREGCQKKNVFFMVFLRIKKITPIFLSEIRSQMGETNFTFGPIPKFDFFVLWYRPSFSQDSGLTSYFQSCPNSCIYDIWTPDQV